MIVDGAVGMVELALERLNEKHTVELDEERKAAMVSNLLVVLCGNQNNSLSLCQDCYNYVPAYSILISKGLSLMKKRRMSGSQTVRKP